MNCPSLFHRPTTKVLKCRKPEYALQNKTKSTLQIKSGQKYSGQYILPLNIMPHNSSNHLKFNSGF
jgi:hypothetical protein